MKKVIVILFSSLILSNFSLARNCSVALLENKLQQKDILEIQEFACKNKIELSLLPLREHFTSIFIVLDRSFHYDSCASEVYVDEKKVLELSQTKTKILSCREGAVDATETQNRLCVDAVKKSISLIAKFCRKEFESMCGGRKECFE